MCTCTPQALGVSVEELTKKSATAPAPAPAPGGGGGDLIARLEAEKAAAVEAEDYGRAKELKAQIDAAKVLVGLRIFTHSPNSMHFQWLHRQMNH